MEILEETREQLLIDLNKWVEENHLNVNKITDDVYEVVGVGKFLLINPKALTPNEEDKNEILIQDYKLLLDQFEYSLSEDDEIDYLLFQFGTKFYYCKSVEPEFQLFKYLGEAKLNFKQDYPYLGVHGGYELGSGSRLYRDWCKKAKFLGISTLGICEENTLSGVVNFQYTCKKQGIRPIIGETLSVQKDKSIYTVKLFPSSQNGFTNLIILNNKSSKSPNKTVELSDLLKYNTDLFIILHTDVNIDSTLYYDLNKIIEDKRVYYQIDFREWGSDERDLIHLNNLKNYLDNYHTKILPILLTDSYYLDEEDCIIRKHLMKITDVGFRPQSDKLYFKSLDEIFLEVLPLFREEDTDRLFNLIEEGISNCKSIVEKIDFEIKSNGFLLPEYEMTEEEKLKFETNEDLFFDIISKSFEEKVIKKGKDQELYMSRLEREIEILQRGGFINYFLILWDVYRYCRENGILVGLGRGSAAGAATAWLLDITGLDPIEYNLLFERFLNESRIHSSAPDIDADFMAARRDEVKEYVRKKYGYDYVTGIGTYTTLKLKAALKALNRQFGVDPKLSNYISAIVGDEIHYDGRFSEAGRIDIMFKTASKSKQVKEFIQPRRKLVELLPLLLNQPGNTSVHAAGLVILPKKNKKGEEWNVDNGLPVKEMDGLTITEWEGKYLDDLGYIKYDFLGLQQLDKFKRCFDLIEEHYGIRLTYDDIDLKDPKTFEMFREGKTEDVFQFSGGGLSAYVKELGPTELNDLIATAAIYRPGPIEIGVHKSFIERKNGREDVTYELGTEAITGSTYGLWVYQEQIMQACTQVAGFSTSESDGVRKAIGKMLPEELQKYGDKFVEGAVKSGHEKDKAIALWDKFKVFGSYAFNLSHSACYATMGYFSQWLKVNYPLEFWTTSLEFSQDDEIPQKIVEINEGKQIKVVPVDINRSKFAFVPDKTKNVIYWSLSSIKWVGDSSVEHIIQEREDTQGDYFSLEEFVDRVEKRKVNKRGVMHLILAGAFDEIENIKRPSERFRLIEKFMIELRGERTLDINQEEMRGWKDYQFTKRQKELTGIGEIDYREVILEMSSLFKSKIGKFLPIEQLEYDGLRGKDRLVAGLIHEIVVRNSKRGEFCQVTLESNSYTCYITMWNDVFEKYREELVKGRVLLFMGEVEFDGYKKKNVLKSTQRTILEIL